MPSSEDEESMRGFMLDTNVFNRLLDGRFSLEELGSGIWVATHVQRDELNKTANSERKGRLLSVLDEVEPRLEPTASFVIGMSALGLARINDGSDRHQRMRDRLAELDKKKKERRLENQARDVLIAETGLQGGWTLVTADKNLGTLIKEFGGSVLLMK